MPIIPVVGRLRQGREPPPWPQGALDPASLRAGIDERLGAVLGRLLEMNGIDIPFRTAVVDWFLADKLAGTVEARIRKGLVQGGLA